MKKITVVVSCPIDTYSGYGARSRDFVKALLALEKYDVKILSQRWGQTRVGYLADHNEVELASLIIPTLTKAPQVWIQITVPNEFKAIGEYNIGVTAGIETTLCDASWIQGCNQMNLVLTSSEHSKQVFKTSAYKVEERGTEKGTLQIQTAIEVLFEGIDTQKYKPLDRVNKGISLVTDLDSIQESFCYLFVGHWLQGDLGQDRKNVGYLVQSFLETFKNHKTPPALILKTQSANASILDRDKILKTVDSLRRRVGGKLPNIYLLHGEISDTEMNTLYNHPKVKAMISLTKGEGFGRPLLEFSAVNKPIIASAWSGHADFLQPEYCLLIGGRLTDVHSSAVVKNTILAESQWFTPDDSQVSFAFKELFNNYKKYIPLAKRQGYKSRSEFSFEAMVTQLGSFLKNYIPEFPEQVELKLPELKIPKLKKING